MTRKDYIVLAAALANNRPHVAQRFTRQQRAEYEVWLSCRRAIMDTLANDNPRFDRGRFITATEETPE